jgi:hypothetical protein
MIICFGCGEGLEVSDIDEGYCIYCRRKIE